MTRFFQAPRRAARLVAAASLMVAVGGCNPDELLTVEDPDIINPGNLNSPAGANAQRLGVIHRFTEATVGGVGGDPPYMFAALLTDEFRATDTFIQRITADQRTLNRENSFLGNQLRRPMRVRTEARAAVAGLREFAPTPAYNIGQMWALSAFMTNQMAETFCNDGIPLASGLDAQGEIVYGPAVSTQLVYQTALAETDSALASMAATGGGNAATAASYTNLARLVRARVLLNTNQRDQAATVAAQIPVTFRYITQHSTTATENGFWQLSVSVRRYGVADQEGGNGLNFISANDPRVRIRNSTAVAQDGTSQHRAFANYIDRASPANIATGIEAQLIVAEQQLAGGSPASGAWLATLNALRANAALVQLASSDPSATAMPPLVDPGTPAGRVSLLFRERAFWLFGQGRRLGDLRRMIRQYGALGFTEQTIFPVGDFNPAAASGRVYGNAVALPIPVEEANNPSYGAAACDVTRA